MWRIIDQALNEKLLGPFVERLVRGDWPVTSHWEHEWEKLEKLRKRDANRYRDKSRRAR